jgi:uncharacterized protein
MGLAQEINDRLKTAMKAKDSAALSVLRMVKSRLKEYTIANLIKDDISDEDAIKVIATYVKQLKKSLVEFEKGGEAAQENIASINFEIEYLSPFLPQMLDEAQTQTIVEQVIADLGNPPKRQSGMVMGRIMKEHKGKVDAGLVKQIVDRSLSE